MDAQYVTELDSDSMDDIIFVRSVEKPQTPKPSNGRPTKRAKPNDVPARAVSPSLTKRAKSSGMPAHAVSPGPATKQKRDSNSSQTTTSIAHPKVPQSEQPYTEEEKFMLETRKALEQALGKEALEAHEKVLTEEKESTEKYILDLEAAVKQQHGTPVVQAEGHDESARTEIKLLRESNTKLAEERTTIGRCVRLLTDENVVLKRQHEGASAEIQILHEHNTTLAEENAALSRDLKLLKDEQGTYKAERQEEAYRIAIKTLREQNRLHLHATLSYSMQGTTT